MCITHNARSWEPACARSHAGFCPNDRPAAKTATRVLIATSYHSVHVILRVALRSVNVNLTYLRKKISLPTTLFLHAIGDIFFYYLYLFFVLFYFIDRLIETDDCIKNFFKINHESSRRSRKVTFIIDK